MATILKVLGFIISYAPLILRIVREVEKLMGAYPGEEKREAAVRLIDEALAARGIVIDPQLVGAFVDLIVAVLNRLFWKRD